MTAEFTRIGVLARPGTGRVVESLHCLLACLAHRRKQVYLDDATAALLRPALSRQSGPSSVDRSGMGVLCDLVVVVGGDGHILGAARDFAPFKVPILGINRGRLGFLADISPDEIEARVLEVLAGNYTVAEHFLLQGELIRNGKNIAAATALNEVVVHPGTQPRMMEFDLKIDDQFVYNQHSDGLIVSTPTGSTAYSLSAGGPIMHPNLDALVLVPMFPHTLNSRPLVVAGDSRIEVQLGEQEHEQFKVSFDSQTALDARPQDRIHIGKAKFALRLIHPPGHSFYQVCRSKLDWASRSGG